MQTDHRSILENGSGQMRPRRMRKLAFVPTLITLLNLICGFAAIHFAMRAMYDLGAGIAPEDVLTLNRRVLERVLPSFLSVGAGLVLLGMLLDCFDGLIARVTQSTTNFGGQLDSLADVISFGIAPATLMVAFMTRELAGTTIVPSPISEHWLGRFTWISAALYAAFTAVRLARFNVEHAQAGYDYKTFRGLPSPGAALIMVSIILMQDHSLRPDQRIAVWIHTALVYSMPIIATCIAFLMISRVPYRRLHKAYLLGKQPFGQFMFVMAVFLVFISFPAPTLICISLFYGASGPVLWLVRHFGGNKTAPASVTVDGSISGEQLTPSIKRRHA